MKNKIKLFDKLVYLEMLNQIKITGIIASAIYFVVGIIISLGLWVSVIGDDFSHKGDFPGEVFYMLLPLVFIYVPIMAKSVFTYQNRRNASDFYHGLPIKRETMFGSSMAAVATWTVGIMLISVVLPVLTVMILPQYDMDFKGMFEVLGNVFAMAILSLGAFSVGINLTGNNFTNVIVSLMILFVPRMISSAINLMVQTYMPFLVMNTGASLLNNSYNLIFGWLINIVSGDLGQIPYIASWGYTFILGSIYLVLGALAHKHRKSEMAAQASAYKLVQPVTRMIPAYLFGIIGIFFFLQLVFRFTWESDYSYDIEISYYWGMFSMIILSLLAYVIYELITTRRWRKVAQSFKQLPILAGIIVGTAFLVWGGTTIALKREVNADKMKYIEISSLEGLEWLDTKGNVKIKDEEIFEIIDRAYNDQMEEFYTGYGYWESYEVSIGINQGGFTFYRVVHINSEDMDELRKAYLEETYSDGAVLKLPAYNSSEMSVDVYMDYDIEWDIYENTLYKALREDLMDVPYYDVINVEKDEVLCYVSIYIYSGSFVNGKRLDVTIPVSKKTPKAFEYAIEGFVDNGDAVLEEALEFFDVIADDTEYISGSVDLDGYIYIDGEKVETSIYDLDKIVKPEELKHFAELMKRYEQEEGDTLFVFSGYVSWYLEHDDIGDSMYFEFARKIPKDLADEFKELLDKYGY